MLPDFDEVFDGLFSRWANVFAQGFPDERCVYMYVMCAAVS